MEDIIIKEERLTPGEYIEFLTRTDLGSQYPKERFRERVTTLLQKASISLAARDSHSKLVGICFGITDFSYWLFLTDLGVDRDYVKKGIGKRLVAKALETAGGEDNIVMYACVNENATGFYEKLGMTRSTEVMELWNAEWTPFTVSEKDF